MKEKEITIETPEKIRFKYSIAEIGTRIAAYTMDLIIQSLLILLVYLLLSASGFSFFSMSDYQSLIIAFMFLLIFFIKWGYYVLFEVIMEGQTPGKKMMRIRVIKNNGEPLDFETIVLRNLLRAVDGFPGIPLLGGFIAMIDKKTRRLGDIVSNTLVVNEIQFNLKEPNFYVNFSRVIDEEKVEKLILKLNENELYIIRRFLNERGKLPINKEQEIAHKLSGQVKELLKIDEVVVDPILFLERVYKQHGN